jgi:hypothetical protein
MDTSVRLSQTVTLTSLSVKRLHLSELATEEGHNVDVLMLDLLSDL